MDKFRVYGSFEVRRLTAEEENGLPEEIKRFKSKLLVKGKFTQVGVKNANGFIIPLEAMKKAMPSLKYSYIKDTHKGNFVGVCINGYFEDENNPQSLVYADYVVWNVDETKDFVQRLYASNQDDSMGISWEIRATPPRYDASQDAKIVEDFEIEGAAFTRIPAYASTYGFLDLSYLHEMASTGIRYFASVSDEDKQRQKERSAKYGISIREDGNVTKPAEYADVSDEDFADPVNYAYPCNSEERTRAALHYWGMPRNKDKYSSKDQAIITRRLIKFAKKFGIDTGMKEEAEVDELEELRRENAQLKEKIAQLEASSKELETLKAEKETLKQEKEALEAKVAEFQKKEIQAQRLAELGDLAEKDKDYSLMSDAEFQIYKLTKENEVLKQKLQAENTNAPLGKLESQFQVESKVKKILEKI